MPMPHQEMRRLIKRRITGLEGTERIKALREIQDQLPGYYQGPYGEIRKWVVELIEEAQLRRSVRHQDPFFIPREGAAQVVLVGPPNAGKSSLLHALTRRQVAVGDYPFTTLRPVAGMLKMEGAVIQLVDLPGLLDGAVDGRGGGRAVIGCIKMADAILYAAPLSPQGLDEFREVLTEVSGEAGVDLPCGIAATKGDLPGAGLLWCELTSSLPEVPAVRCSVTDGLGLDAVARLIWELCGLIRVYCKPKGKPVSPEAIVLPPGATVADFISSLNRAWLPRFRQARITGQSVRFDGHAVGLQHALADGDVVELSLR